MLFLPQSWRRQWCLFSPYLFYCTGGWKKSHVNTVLAELLVSTASRVSDSSSPGEPSNNSNLGHYLATASWATPRKNYPAEPSLSTEVQDKMKQNCCFEPLNIKVTYNPVTDNWNKKIHNSKKETKQYYLMKLPEYC